jgi:3-oxoacyl-[acyl-carrier protein] reductase
MSAAIVTGAAGAIGRAVAEELSAQDRTVVLVDRSEAVEAVRDELRGRGARAEACVVDLADADAPATVMAAARRAGGPAVLVNNAGITRDNLLFKMSEQDWDSVLGVHLRGAFLMSRATQAHMTETGWGRIVSLSSVSALGNRGQANYSAAKAGLQGFTKTLAIELGPFGVTVNAVAPGFIVTDMTAATAQRVGIDFEQYQQAAATQIPMRRVGRPEDVAAVIAFLAGEDASYVSGQVIYVAGGPRD